MGLTGEIDAKSRGIRPTLAPGSVGATRNPVHYGSATPRTIQQWSVAGSCQVRCVTGLNERRQQIKQTTLGAATVVLETGDHPALLKDAVTTPAGCTVDGLMELEEGKLRVTLIKAVVKATQRAKELAYG